MCHDVRRRLRTATAAAALCSLIAACAGSGGGQQHLETSGSATMPPEGTASASATPAATHPAIPTVSPRSSPTPKKTGASTTARTPTPSPTRSRSTPRPTPTTPRPTTSTPPAGTTHVIHMSDFSFSPAALTIKVGDKVKAVNDMGSHTFTSSSGPRSWDSGGVDQGSSYTVTFTVAGSYSFVCSYHEGIGMKGTLTVR